MAEGVIIKIRIIVVGKESRNEITKMSLNEMNRVYNYQLFSTFGMNNRISETITIIVMVYNQFVSNSHL